MDNIIADSSHDAGVWVGESGGLGGVYRIERNIFSNFTQKGQCGGGEYLLREMIYHDIMEPFALPLRLGLFLTDLFPGVGTHRRVRRSATATWQ